MKKRYVVILILIIVYFTTLFLLKGASNVKNSKLASTIIVNNSSVWQLKDKKWYNVVSNSEINDLSWQEFNIIVDSEYFGKYNVVHDESKWYLFDNERKAYSYSGHFVAYQADYNMPVKSYEEKEITDYTYVNQVLGENNLPLNQELTVNLYINVDYDNDGVKENFYFISNAFPMESDPENIFSIVFMEKTGTIYPIYKSIAPRQGFNGCMPYMDAIIDVNDDKKYELIISCSKYSIKEPIDILYEFSNNKFSVIISNE